MTSAQFFSIDSRLPTASFTRIRPQKLARAFVTNEKGDLLYFSKDAIGMQFEGGEQPGVHAPAQTRCCGDVPYATYIWLSCCKRPPNCMNTSPAVITAIWVVPFPTYRPSPIVHQTFSVHIVIATACLPACHASIFKRMPLQIWQVSIVTRTPSGTRYKLIVFERLRSQPAPLVVRYSSLGSNQRLSAVRFGPVAPPPYRQ